MATAVDDVSAKGEFTRTDAPYRSWIHPAGTAGQRFVAAPKRYHLFISLACPWANGCYCLLRMKGLEDVIGVSITHPTWEASRPGKDEHAGWAFRAPTDPPMVNPTGKGSFGCAGCVPCPFGDGSIKFVRDLYETSTDQHPSRFTVPILWDLQEKTIVNNESTEILRIFNSSFNDFAKRPEVDLYPTDLLPQINETMDWVYASINNGVYRCGFATTQGAYDEAIEGLSKALERAEVVLSWKRYMCGDRMTAADLRLFMTLVRYDEVYAVYFKTNTRLVREYPNLLGHTREMFQNEYFRPCIDMDHIKTHYFTSHPALNVHAVIPRGPGLAVLEQPHGRK